MTLICIMIVFVSEVASPRWRDGEPGLRESLIYESNELTYAVSTAGCEAQTRSWPSAQQWAAWQLNCCGDLVATGC